MSAFTIRPRARAFLVVLLVLPGCESVRDRLGGIFGDDEAPSAAEVPDDAEPASPDATASAQTWATPRADVGAAAAPSTPTEPPPEGTRLLELDAVAMVPKTGGLFASDAYLELSAAAKVVDRIEPGTGILTKVACESGRRILSDAGYMGPTETPLEQLGSGGKANVNASLFMQGFADVSRCQAEFRLGSMGGGITLPLGAACLDDGKTTPGPCRPPVAAVSMSTAKETGPVEIGELTVENVVGHAGGYALRMSFLADVNTAVEQTQLRVKAACRRTDKKYAESTWVGLGLSPPFRREAGESAAFGVNLFMSDPERFADPPEACDLTFSAMSTPMGLYGGAPQTEVIRESCWRDLKLSDGRCDPTEPTPPPPKAAGKDSLTISGLKIEPTVPYAPGAQIWVSIAGEVTLEEPVDETTMLQAEVTCSVGGTTRVEQVGLYVPDVGGLRPGETVPLSTTAFGGSPFDKVPRRCKAELSVMAGYYGTAGTPIGRWCFSGGKTKKC